MILEKEKLEKAQVNLDGVKLYQENVSDSQKILGFGEDLLEGEYVQQGDCLVVQLGDTNFKDAPIEIKGEISKDNVVVKGTNNSHALYDGEFDVYRDGDQVYLDVKTFAILDHVRDVENRVHAEHHAQYIPKGKYFVKGILEFDHFEKMVRKIVD